MAWVPSALRGVDARRTPPASPRPSGGVALFLVTIVVVVVDDARLGRGLAHRAFDECQQGCLPRRLELLERVCA
jgi:hypothetical protein